MRLSKDKIGFIGDLHIGVHQASTMWHTISLEFAEWVKKEFTDRGIKDIIIPGDVLNDRNEIAVTTLHYLPQFFKILEDFNIIITVGNHDCYYSNRSDVHSLKTLNEWSNVTIVDVMTTVTLRENVITFCPWYTDVERIPASDIIVGHFDIKSFKMAGSKVCDRGVRSADLLEKAELIITGHYHQTQERVYKNGRILYLGSPYELNWGEANTPKGVYSLDLESKSYEFISNEISPRHRKIRLSELLSVGSITEELRKEFKGNIVKFIVDVQAKPQTVDNLIKKFRALAPIELKVEYEYTEQYDLSDEDYDFQGVNVNSDMTEFVKSLEGIEHEAEIINYLQDIYSRAEVLIT